MSITRRAFLEIAGSAAVGVRFHAQKRTYTLEPGANGRVLKDPAGRVVLAYLTSKPEGLAGNSACCIHPLNTLAGERVTDLAPSDHKDHRGLFFAWHNLEFRKGDNVLKGDFWGWGRYAPVEDRVIVNKDVRLVRADNRSAELSIANDWTIGTQAVMRESSTIGVSDDRGARILDLSYRFTSEYNVTVNQMAFTGVCFRCRKEGPYTFFDPNGEVKLPNSSATDPASDWPSQPWCSHQVTLPGGKILSSALIDHPANPPSMWHGARGVSFLNPCISAPGAVQIPAGKALTLRYRAVAFDGPFPAGMLDQMAAAWRAK
jgi:methane monooxygenase PmoA-like